MKKYMSMLIAVCLMVLTSTSFALDSGESSKNGLYQIQGNWSELKRGWNILTLQILNPDLQPAEIDDLVISYDMVGMAMNPPDNPVTKNASGKYEKKVFLGMKGEWKFDFKVIENGNLETYRKVQLVK